VADQGASPTARWRLNRISAFRSKFDVDIEIIGFRFVREFVVIDFFGLVEVVEVVDFHRWLLVFGFEFTPISIDFKDKFGKEYVPCWNFQLP
jgi:hypothetical protein